MNPISSPSFSPLFDDSLSEGSDPRAGNHRVTPSEVFLGRKTQRPALKASDFAGTPDDQAMVWEKLQQELQEEGHEARQPDRSARWEAAHVQTIRAHFMPLSSETRVAVRQALKDLSRAWASGNDQGIRKAEDSLAGIDEVLFMQYRACLREEPKSSSPPKVKNWCLQQLQLLKHLQARPSLEDPPTSGTRDR